MKRLYFSMRVVCLVLTMLIAELAVAETIKVSGHGQAPVPIAKHKKDQPALNQSALADAQEMARRDALKQAILQLFINRKAIDSALDSIAVSVLQHSATLVKGEDVRSAEIRSDVAEVDLALQVDAVALRGFLEDNFNLSLTAQTEGKLKIFVMSYTVEAIDPNRANPITLHEEVIDDQKGVHSSNYNNSNSNAESHSKSGAIQASSSSSHEAAAFNRASASGSESYQAANVNPLARASSNSSASGTASFNQVAAAETESHHTASVNAQGQASSRSSSSSTQSGQSYEDTSHYYRRVVDYADPTHKGVGLSNEVRVELEGMLNTSGFDVETLNVSMMNREFAGDDDLVNAVLAEMRTNASVGQEDYVAIALNSFTPANITNHRFTSKVTYRIIRVKDGKAFLPAQDLAGDSGNTAPSDDVARTYAIKSALRKVEDVLPGQIKQALRRAQNAEIREATQVLVSYSIVIENPPSFTTSTPIRAALKQAGFAFDRGQFRAGQAETLTITLNGRSGQNVMEAIEGALGAFEVLSMDKQNAHVRAR